MRRSIIRSIRNNFLVGLALVTPIGVTILIANWVFVFITNVFLTQKLEASGKQVLYRIAALLIVLFLLFLIGFTARSFLGRRIYKIGDHLLTRLPVINRIYVQVRHISEVLFSRRDTLFREAVLVQYPRKGLYSIAFLTAPTPTMLATRMTAQSGTQDFVSLFVPTTPNPTSGVFIISPRDELIRVEMDVADAMKFVVSAGAVPPGDTPGERSEGLLEKLEAWASRDKD